MKSHGEVKLIGGKRVATTEYRSWQMMKNRCFNPKASDYRRYGKRGITIDPRWHAFENFLADMGRKPNSFLTLERRDNDGPYTKENCYWATRKQQAQNRGAYNTFCFESAEMVRELYATGRYYQYQLAGMLGCTQTDISQITRNVRWAREIGGGQ